MQPQYPYDPSPQPSQTPQPPQSPQPQQQTPPPFFQPATAPAPIQPPRKSRGKLIAYIFAALVFLGVAGYMAHKFLSSGMAKSPGNASTAHVGSYAYVHACNAFTAEDFEAAVGAASNRSIIETEFSQETDAADPGRGYESRCVRHMLDGLSIEFTVHQYPDTKRTSEQLFLLGLSSAVENPEFGGLTNYSEQQFTFEKDNKVARVLVQGYGDMPDAQIETLAKTVAQKAANKMAVGTDLARLRYPAELSGVGYSYQNACSLWGLPDFQKQFGSVDKTFVQMTYAEELVAQPQLQYGVNTGIHSKCVLGTKRVSGSFAYIDTYYYPDTAQAKAGYDSYVNADEDVTVPEFGDHAVLQAYDAVAQQYETIMVLRGTTLLKIQFVPEDTASRGNSQVQADVKAIAKTVLSRLR